MQGERTIPRNGSKDSFNCLEGFKVSVELASTIDKGVKERIFANCALSSTTTSTSVTLIIITWSASLGCCV